MKYKTKKNSLFLSISCPFLLNLVQHPSITVKGVRLELILVVSQKNIAKGT